MRWPEELIVSKRVEDKGLSLHWLIERYSKAALYVYALDRATIPYLKQELRSLARWYAARERWSKQTVAHIEELICLLLYDAEKGGRTSAEFRGAAIPIIRRELRSRRSLAKRATLADKTELLGVSRATWYRHYAKPYEQIYLDFIGWADIGLNHIRKKYNADELDG